MVSGDMEIFQSLNSTSYNSDNSDKETKKIVRLISHVHEAASGKETKSVTRIAISTFETYDRTDDFAKSQERDYDVLINQTGYAWSECYFIGNISA